MSRKNTLLALAGASLLALTAGVLWQFVLRPSPPAWKVALMDQPMMKMPETPHPSSSQEGLQARMHLKNDLQRREFWGKSEVDEIIAMIEELAIDLVPVQDVTSDRDWERYFLAWDALSAIRTRVGIGAPIDPGERARLAEILLRYSHAAAPSIRLSMAEALCWSGLIFEDERVDARVREMMSDPDPMVASNARSQHRSHTQGRERWAEYQRRLQRERK